MAGKTNYKVEYDEQAEKLCKLGLTDKELGDFFGVTERTINNWKAAKDSFFQSIKRGKVLADANVVDSLYQRATGYTHKALKIMQYEGVPIEVEFDQHYPPETTACLAWLHNRQRERWQRNPNPNGGSGDIPPTTIVFEVQDARTRENPTS